MATENAAPPTEFKRWDQYVAEAAKPPFKLPVTGDETVVVTQPDGGQIMQLARLVQTSQDPKALILVVAGDAGVRLVELFEGAPWQVMNNVLHDIFTHFGIDLGEAPASSRS